MEELAVFGLAGKLVMRLAAPDAGRHYRLDTGDWPEGIYFYSVRLSDGRIACGNFLIVR